MADFTESEILGAVAAIFRAQLSPSKTGGTLDTDTEYAQLQEMISLAFLLYPRAIFYLARLVANRLVSKTSQEVALIEDLLVSLRDLGQVGKPFTSTTLLSDANTALLGLDAATSVVNRPEATRFNRIMDKVADELRNNVVSPDGRLVRPREEARDVIRADLERLKDLHEEVLEAVVFLRDLVFTFLALDIPSKVAASALANIRTRLSAFNETLTKASYAENIALSREVLLNTLASKAAVSVIADFSDPSKIKYHGPHNPVPETVNHAGQSGECEPASVFTGRSPWDLPILDTIELAVDGGAAQGVDLKILTGPRLVTRNREDFEVSSKLHVAVEPAGKSFTTYALAAAPDRVMVSIPTRGLSFKDLGAPLSVQLTLVHDGVSWTTHIPSDMDPRVITELMYLQAFPVSGPYYHTSYDFGGTTYYDVLELTGVPILGFDSGAGLGSRHVGDYFWLSNDGGATIQRFEILEVLDATLAVIDPRGETPFPHPLNPAEAYLMGVSDQTLVIADVAPAFSLAIPASVKVDIGPVIKTAEFSAGTKSVADLISDIESEAGVSAPNDIGAQLNWHARALEMNGRLVLVPRSRSNPFLSIASQALRAQDPIGPGVWEEDSAHESLGYSIGQRLDNRFDTNAVLNASDLADLIEQDTVGIVAEAVPETIGEGTNLRTVAGTTSVRDTTVGFAATGAEPGDQIEIEGGVAAGVYRISSVLSTELVLDKNDTFPANEENLNYKILKERVEIKSEATDRTSEVEVVSAPAVFGLTVGKYYGTSTEFQAANGKGDLLEFSLAEEGDVLKLPGRDPIEIESVDGDTLTLAETIPSNTVNSPFVIRTQTGEQYDAMREKLLTFTTSANLLRKNGFDENLDAVDFALTAAIIPGQNFASSRNNARNLLNDLAALLTSFYERTDEHLETLQ